jgi:cytochrome b561
MVPQLPNADARARRPETAPLAYDDVERYGATAIALHWLTALLIVCGFTLGLSMVDLPLSRRKLEWYAWHKWIGVTVFLLTCARLAWRWGHPPPLLPPMPEWQARAAKVSHVALYLLLIIIPLSGWIYSSSTGIQVVYLGLFPLPDLVAKDRDLAHVLRLVHVSLNFTLLAVVCVHAAAALKHHFHDRDTVLSRMLPGSRTRS